MLSSGEEHAVNAAGRLFDSLLESGMAPWSRALRDALVLAVPRALSAIREMVPNKAKSDSKSNEWCVVACLLDKK